MLMIWWLKCYCPLCSAVTSVPKYIHHEIYRVIFFFCFSSSFIMLTHGRIWMACRRSRSLVQGGGNMRTPLECMNNKEEGTKQAIFLFELAVVGHGIKSYTRARRITILDLKIAELEGTLQIIKSSPSRRTSEGIELPTSGSIARDINHLALRQF